MTTVPTGGGEAAGPPPDRSLAAAGHLLTRAPAARLAHVWTGAVLASPTTGPASPGSPEEQSRLQLAGLEAAANAIVITDREGRIMWANPAFTRLTGWRLDEVKGQNPRFLKSGRHDRALYEELWRTILSGQVWAGEMINRRKDGSLYCEEQTITPVRTSGGEDVTHFVAVKVDVTERRAAREALRASERRYRSLFERNVAGVYRATLDGRIVECNDAFARILGYPSAAELVGRPSEDLYREPAQRRAFLERLLAEETLVNHETESRNKDGATAWILESATLVREGDEPYLEGTIVDIGERKTLERQLAQAERMEAVGQLAGGVAHDFSNVLSVIGGYADLALARSDAASPLRPYLEEVRRAADRGTSLVRQLLEFGRKRVAELGVLDVDEVVRGVEGMLRRLTPENLEIVISPRASPGLVRGDRGQLEQVIVNLAVNARDAMPRGGRLVIETARADLDEAYCRTHVGARPGPHVVLSVSDTGMGMGPETRARIFDPFFTTKAAGRGTGLGLTTVSGIVRRAGGSIWVYSEPGQGAVFKVYWPAAAAEAPAGPEAERTPTEPGPVPRGMETILLVEDEEALRALARELLESLGYTVLEAQHGEEALELSTAHEGPIHLLMTDLVMPKVQGRELARAVAEARPETRVLFVSGYAAEGDTEAGTLPARHAFLQKPYTAAALGTSIRRLLDGA